MTANRELAGRRTLVTGGTRGIGQAVAAKLREAGAAALITARTRGAGLDDHHFVAADVTTAPGYASVVGAVRDRLGGIDIIIHGLSGPMARTRNAVNQDDGCTDASSGIGSVYADRLVRRGHELILVARDRQRLDAPAIRLSENTGHSAGVEDHVRRPVATAALSDTIAVANITVVTVRP